MAQLSLSKTESPILKSNFQEDISNCPVTLYTLQNIATLQKPIKENEFKTVRNNRRERSWSGGGNGNKGKICESLKKQ